MQEQQKRKNRLVEELIQSIKNKQSHLRYVKRHPQLYYYQLGNCIFERLYNNTNSFEYVSLISGKSSRTEQELINLKAKKIFYE